MAVSPANARDRAGSPIWREHVLARGFGGAVIASADGGGAASYDARGQRYVLIGAPGAALDVERADTVLAAELRALLEMIAPGPPLQCWTRIEVAAKLLEHPVHLLLRGLAAAPPTDLGRYFAGLGLHIVSGCRAGLWISLGRCKRQQDIRGPRFLLPCKPERI
jgi:hypothetical protein